MYFGRDLYKIAYKPGVSYDNLTFRLSKVMYIFIIHHYMALVTCVLNCFVHLKAADIFIAFGYCVSEKGSHKTSFKSFYGRKKFRSDLH